MNGLFWNCRGAGEKGMTTCFSHIIKDHSLDFVGIQETKKKNFDPKYLRRVDPSDRFSWNWIPSVGKSGGVLCGVKKETSEIVSWTAGKYLLQATVFDVKLKSVWTLVVVYGAAHDDKRDDFLAELASTCSNISTPYVIGGDFNILRESCDKNKDLHRSLYMDRFNSIIQNLSLREIHMGEANIHGPISKGTLL